MKSNGVLMFLTNHNMVSKPRNLEKKKKKKKKKKGISPPLFCQFFFIHLISTICSSVGGRLSSLAASKKKILCLAFISVANGFLVVAVLYEEFLVTYTNI
jgi:hypothetical protein